MRTAIVTVLVAAGVIVALWIGARPEAEPMRPAVAPTFAGPAPAGRWGCEAAGGVWVPGEYMGAPSDVVGDCAGSL